MSAEPQRPAIVVLGKARGRKPESRQLLARASAAAALWHQAPEPRPMVLVVARDAPDPIPDVRKVAERLEQLGVPRGRILARAWSNCTLIEARAARVLSRAHGLGTITVLTHPYHRRRVAKLFGEVLDAVSVVAVEPSLFAEHELPAGLTHVPDEIARSMPRGADLLRERLVELALSALHGADPRGRVERWLAARVRPAARGSAREPPDSQAGS